MPPILVTQRVPEPALDILRRAAEIEVNPEPDRIWTYEELRERLPGRRAVMAMLTNRIDSGILEAAPELRIVANVAVGYDNVDIETAVRRGVMVTNTPEVLTETTADFTWALLLAVARRLPEADRFVRAGRWKAWGPMLLLGTDVYGKTLGIVGLGRIGRAVARRAGGFGVRVLYHQRHQAPPDVEQTLGAQYVSFDRLLSESDFVSLHTPLSDETCHLIDAVALDRMKPTAYLVNVARGPIVDEQALISALRERRIAGAGLDVFEREPQVPEDLKRLDNCVLAPHVGSATLETRTRMAEMAAENIVVALAGQKPPNLVNPQVWSSDRAG